MTGERASPGVRLLGRYRWAVRLFAVGLVLYGGAWLTVTVSGSRVANVLFGMLVAVAGLFGLLGALVAVVSRASRPADG